MLRIFSKKEKPSKVPPYIDKVIPLSHSELEIRLNKLTGEVTVLSFKTPLVGGKGIYPRCWVHREKEIDLDFDIILRNRIPYDKGSEERKSYIKNMNTLINIFHQSYSKWDVNDLYIKEAVYAFIKSFESWEEGTELFNTFMESTLEWLKLQEKKFEELHSLEPELKLTEEEYQAILQSMQRFNPK